MDPPKDSSPIPSRTENHRHSSKSSNVRSSYSSQRSSTRNASFFRSLLRNKNFDYHSDRPIQQNSASSMKNVFKMRTQNHPSEPQLQIPFETELVDTELHQLSRARTIINRIIKSTYWKVILIVLTIFLLFGAQIRDIFLPKSMDTTIDILFTITLAIFILDIIMRIPTEPNYFHWKFRDDLTDKRTFSVGSFVFYCEIIATLAVLYEISYINERETTEIYLVLNSFGIPVRDGLASINEASPVERDLALIVTIAKTLRVARFIRSSTALKISAKINFYHFLNLLPSNTCRRTIDEEDTVRRSESFYSNRSSTVSFDGAYSKPSSIQQLLGIGRRDTMRQKHHDAASKIQKAWRRVLYKRNQYVDEAGPEYENGNNDNSKRSVLSQAASTKSRMDIGAATKKRNESQVGSAMRELTGQRVAIGIIITFVLTVIFSYKEIDATRPSAMMVLHNQTSYPSFADRALDAARSSSVPDLFRFQDVFGNLKEFQVKGEDSTGLRDNEIVRITIEDAEARSSIGYFTFRNERREEATVMLLSTIFIILVWFFGVTAFAGPVMILVVIPIERMVRLLGMLMMDPLGYQSTRTYRRFVSEEDEITENTRWTKEVLKGMETSFLMSTILRIGSLMKVGFGSAGVEIIRRNLEKGQSKNMLMLSSQGSTVHCIFLFCDIRQFTDATECLQEEVFVFTNRIAAVVHSICHSFGGSANKNIGDAFLLSWTLDEHDTGTDKSFTAKKNQADKALLSVVKICIALHHDDFYIESMTEGARTALLKKLSRRKGPVVQMGFGLHAGKAVQGAIGSQRKIDATYVSEAVERAEFLESATKKYGVKVLMSDDFHSLLHPSNRRRCRKVDQILMRNQDDDNEEDDVMDDENIMELWTFDMDIDALWEEQRVKKDNESDSESGSERLAKRDSHGRAPNRRNLIPKKSRRLSFSSIRPPNASDELNESSAFAVPPVVSGAAEVDTQGPKLSLPSGPALYNSNVWKFNSGLQSFYAKDWQYAKQCFQTILDRFEDGPSRYFLNQIEKHNEKPPRDFLPYGSA